MLKENIKTALRNIKNQKGYSFISILGLAMGMAVSFLILYYVIYEFSYDKHQEKYNRIYTFYWNGGEDKSYGTTPFVLADVIRDRYPQIEKLAQVSWENFGNPNLIINNEFMPVKNFYYADPGIFDILSFKFLSGNADSFRDDINSVIISHNIVSQSFNNRDVIGKLILINKSGDSLLLKVAGVIEDAPVNSHFRPDFIVNMSKMKKSFPSQFLSLWGVNNPLTYVLLKEGINKSDLENILNDNIKIIPDNPKIHYSLLPLSDMHLYANNIFGLFGERGNIENIYIFSIIALLTLLIACINFVNISTARSVTRYKEMGLRKVFGANRFSLIKQILTESIILVFMALPFSLFIIEILMPYAEDLLERKLEINYLFNWQFTILAILIVFLLGIISGVYTAFYVSKNTPTDILRNKFMMKSSKSGLRRLLISFQFIIFTGLLVGSYVIFRQMGYIQHTDLGYDRQNVIVTNLPGGQNEKCISFINELKKYPQIIEASITSSVPPLIGSTIFSQYSMPTKPDKKITYQLITSDANIFSTLGLELKKGHFLTNDDDLKLKMNFFGIGEDEQESKPNKIGKAVINETAEKDFGFTNGIGNIIEYGGRKLEIVGVLKDFYSKSFYEPITPLVMIIDKSYTIKIAIRYKAGETKTSLDLVKSKWKEFFPFIPMEFTFVDKEFEKIYNSDTQFGQLITFFTIISILIAVIGLAGLVAFTSSQKTKEIGIRKILGASTRSLIILMIKEIIILSIIGCIISFPITYYLMGKWLNNFAYKIDVTVMIYFIVFFITLSISFLAVIFQVIKVAVANPVEALKYE